MWCFMMSLTVSDRMCLCILLLIYAVFQVFFLFWLLYMSFLASVVSAMIAGYRLVSSSGSVSVVFCLSANHRDLYCCLNAFMSFYN
jgi:hypothetical protein